MQKVRRLNGQRWLHTLPTSLCGFVIHPEKGWYAPLSHAKVLDPTCNLHNGNTEFKCLHSKCDKSPQEACNDFFCKTINGKFCLNSNHQYHHQVQLQLYVHINTVSWCKLNVYTPASIYRTQRIYSSRSGSIKHSFDHRCRKLGDSEGTHTHKQLQGGIAPTKIHPLVYYLASCVLYSSTQSTYS